MDSFTHIALGACIGEVIAGKQLGKKALLIGALANSLPDIDFVTSFYMPLTANLLAHRGFTHSFLFIALAGPLLAFLSMKLFSKAGVSFGKWTFFWSFQMFIHIFIDAFNAYGTAWFEPFSHYRVSFNTMFVADPLFTIWPGIAAIALLIVKMTNRHRIKWAVTGLLFSSVYLASGIVYKSIVDDRAKTELLSMGVKPDRYFSTPTPLNNILWYIVAQSDSGFYIGYRSLFDHKEKMGFRYSCRNAAFLQSASNKEDIERLIRFSDGFYTADMRNDTLLFNDLRFGEIAGWADTLPRCVFYYYPQMPEANDLIVQRGRFAKWDGQALIAFLRRIRGS